MAGQTCRQTSVNWSFTNAVRSISTLGDSSLGIKHWEYIHNNICWLNWPIDWHSFYSSIYQWPMTINIQSNRVMCIYYIHIRHCRWSGNSRRSKYAKRGCITTNLVDENDRSHERCCSRQREDWLLSYQSRRSKMWSDWDGKKEREREGSIYAYVFASVAASGE